MTIIHEFPMEFPTKSPEGITDVVQWSRRDISQALTTDAKP